MTHLDKVSSPNANNDNVTSSHLEKYCKKNKESLYTIYCHETIPQTSNQTNCTESIKPVIPTLPLSLTHSVSRVGTVERAIAFHQYGPSSISRPLSIVTVCMRKKFVGCLLCTERFSPGTPVYPSHQKPTLIFI